MVKLPPIGLGGANLLKASLPEFIEIAARHRFASISVRPWAFGEALRRGATAAGLRKLLADAGVTVTLIDGLSSGLPGMPDPASMDGETRARMPPDVLEPPGEELCFRTAGELGAGMLNVAAYRGSQVPLEVMADAIGGICRRAAPHGILVELEFLPESGIPDIGHAVRLIELCGEANCGLTLDVFHLGRSGGGAEDIRRLPKDIIGGIQIGDRDPGQGAHVPMGGRMLPGEGGLPLNEMVQAALENSPGATLDIEVLNSELSALTSDEAARRLAAGAQAWRKTFEAGSG